MADTTQTPSTDATKALNDEKQFMLERSHDNSRISNEHMRAAGQAVILISGGAASAVLAYLTKDKLDPSLLVWAPIGLIGYVAGIVAGAFMLYWSARSIEEYSYAWRLRSEGKADDVEKTWRYAFKIQKRGRIFFALSIFFFGAASVALATAFFNSTPPQLISAQAATTPAGTAPPATTPPQAKPSTSAPVGVRQYLNVVLEAAEKHAGLGGWLGAAGAILAIFATWALARAEYNRTQRLVRARREQEIDLFKAVITRYEKLIEEYKALDLDSDEARDFRALHMGDPELYSMADFNTLPVTSWPTLEAYSEFKRYFTASQRFLEIAAITNANKRELYNKWRKEHDSALPALMEALDRARRA